MELVGQLHTYWLSGTTYVGWVGQHMLIRWNNTRWLVMIAHAG